MKNTPWGWIAAAAFLALVLSSKKETEVVVVEVPFDPKVKQNDLTTTFVTPTPGAQPIKKA